MNSCLGVLLVLTAVFGVSLCSGSLVVSSVPAHLLACYRSGGPELTAPHRLDVFLQILRKLESHSSQLDLRLFTTALLRSLRLDGIEQAPNPIESDYLTPYRASGFQFQRYKLLMDLFLPSQNTASIHEALESDERCLFHALVSSSVRRWERGDEAEVCPLAMQQRQNVATEADAAGRAYSRCPVEEGVVQTQWGTIAAGTVVAAVAAAMEDQSVAMAAVLSTDAFKANVALGEDSPDFNIETLDTVISMPRIANAEINNVWVATLAGDLAEVAVNQGPRVGAVTQNITIGSNNRWNNTLLPRINYILPQNVNTIQWHMTDAEILAGIDGLIIAKELRKWTAQMGSLRLSQILDMYYSQSGVSFDPNIKACSRRENFFRVFDQAELLKEMSNFAQVLSLSQGTVYVPIEEVDRICNAVVDTFVGYLTDILNRNQAACGGGAGGGVASADFVLVTDGAWKKYQVELVVSSVGLQADVSSGRSTLALLHGNTALWIAPPADNLARLYADLQNFTDEWPNRLNFPNVLAALTKLLEDKTSQEAATRASVALSTVVLVASTHDRLTTADIERSRQFMNSLRRNHLDVRFAYAAQDLGGFYELNLESEESDWYLQVESTSVDESLKVFTEEVIRSDIPKRIIGAHCPTNGTAYSQLPFEDSVLVQQKKLYRIHPYYMHDQPMITVQFRTMSQGEIQVCSSRDGAEAVLSCQQIGTLQTASFNVTCQGNSPCHAVTFTVTGVSSTNMCANNDCRLPSQVGFYLEHRDLRCLARTNLATRLSKDNMVLLYVFLAYFILMSNLECRKEPIN